MILTEQHIISKSHPFYDECDHLCFQSKNIYNQGLYNVRQYYFENKTYLNYNANYYVTKDQECYTYLPTKVFCQTLKMVDRNFRSFFSLLKNKTVKNKIPKYLDKEKGRFITIFPKQALSLREFKKSGKIHLSKTEILINTKIANFDLIKEVRVVPKLGFYVIDIVYEVKEKKHRDTGIVSSIDIGLNNLSTVTFNNGDNPLLINGRPLKSINQYYNKKKAKYQEKLKNKHTSRKIQKLTNKRNNKVKDYLHKASHALVNQLVSKDVSTLVIGKNTSMKQDINMGHRNNQNFTQLPIFRFVDMLRYKCELYGIKVVFTEESYTSKYSFFDGDFVPVLGDGKKPEPSGKRVRRGLYRTKEGKLVNADVNGSYNIMKKAIPNVEYTNGIEGLGVNPLLLNIKR